VGDLGLAKSVGAESTEMTQSGMMMGSPHYMSPEQARASKETDFRTDIYSLGCTLYQLLTGTTPYQADDALGVILKHVTDPAPDLQAIMPSCLPALVALVGKMMAKDRNARHASYEELIAELWQVSDIIGQQQAAATAALTPAVASAGPTLKPTAVKAGTVVPTVKQTVVRESKSVIRDSRFVMGGVIATAVLLFAGLFLWSPWTKPSSQSSNTPPLQHSAASSSAALKQLGNVFTNAVGAEMVYIPPGEFMLGSTKEEQAWAVASGRKDEEVKREGEAPREAAIKQGFWMGRTEVTVGQWKQFVKETGYISDGEKKGKTYEPRPGALWSAKKGESWRNPDFGLEPQDNHPVTCMTWSDARMFCEWLTKRERQAGRMPAGMMARLPTEAEWEYACRAGTQTKFWWGDSQEDGKNRFNRMGNDDGFEFVSPVDSFGSRGRNSFGLADMLGNVWEWCLDEYDETQAHEGLWTGNSSHRVMRGGSFRESRAQSRCASRIGVVPSFWLRNNGFRVCYGVDVSGATPAKTSASPTIAPKEGGILTPPETRVPALTTNPKAGEVFTFNVGSNVTMKLMGIPPGEFMQGSTKEEQEWAVANAGIERRARNEGELPRKTRIKQGFWLGRTEVTVGQWKEFVTATGYKSDAEKKGYVDYAPWKGQSRNRVDGLSWHDPGLGSPPQDNHPVCCVSWNDAVAFCEWLTERERKAGRLPANYMVRLPTEAEWEYACRAGTQTKFWWGESKEDGKDRLNWSGKDDGVVWVAPADSFGSRGRNGFGLADMLGNVYELCLDEYDATQAHEECYKGNLGARVLRGGSFSHPPGTCRCAIRSGHDPANSASYCGFRVAVGVVR